MNQTILKASNEYKDLDKYLAENDIRSFLLVHDGSLEYLKIAACFNRMESENNRRVVRFCDFKPNPDYSSIVKGVRIFREKRCDAIIAVGGGSTIDVAKCIKLYSNIDGNGEDGAFLKNSPIPNKVKFLVIPTTAGTGSEATRYAVVYYNGEKQSITNGSIIPSAVLFDPSALKTLPDYQRKSTLLDALCHSIESFWSLNSTDESKEYSKQALKLILNNMSGYLENLDKANTNMQKAAYMAGKAINLTQTTAGHAMCYRLTSQYGIAHGHAAALCVKELWPWMIRNIDNSNDTRGKGYLRDTFHELSMLMGCKDSMGAAEKFVSFIDNMKLDKLNPQNKDYKCLVCSVNPVRLKNNPVRLDEASLDYLYHRILEV